MDRVYWLWAVRDNEERGDFGPYSSLDDAAQAVEDLDAHGQWPEGFDALCKSNGEEWLLDDEWHKLEV